MLYDVGGLRGLRGHRSHLLGCSSHFRSCTAPKVFSYLKTDAWPYVVWCGLVKLAWFGQFSLDFHKHIEKKKAGSKYRVAAKLNIGQKNSHLGYDSIFSLDSDPLGTRRFPECEVNLIFLAGRLIRRFLTLDGKLL